MRSQLPVVLAAVLAIASSAHCAVISSTVIEQPGDTPGTIVLGIPPPVYDVQLPTNESTLVITATAGSNADPGLYCRKLSALPGNDQVPSRDNADYFGEQRVNPPAVTVSSADFGNDTTVRCAVYNRGPSVAPLNFTLSVAYEAELPMLVPSEQSAAQAIFDSCCTSEQRCVSWRENSAAGITDLCALSMNTCNADGELLALDMRGYNLSCQFPSEALMNFTQLQSINLAFNPFLTGELAAVADDLANLEFLQEVSLEGDVRLTGPLSTDGTDGACSLIERTLKSINLNNMQLTGTVPECIFAGFLPLQDFRASSNMLSGTLPDMNPGVGEPALRVVRLAQNNLTGDLPVGWLRQTELVWLDLARNNITGTLVPQQDSAIQTVEAIPPSLTRLEMGYNSLSGGFPEPLYFDGLPNLEWIDMSSNQLTQLPNAWDTAGEPTNLPPLRSILLNNNQLRGEFPVGFGVPTLYQLDISANTLNGTLPSLSNATTGAGQDSAALFTGLMIFKAGFNGFTGPIPEDWSQLGLFNPAVNSTVPDATFDLQNNSLSGELPRFLAYSNVKSLQPFPKVNLTGNSFVTQDCNEYAYTDAVCEDNQPPLPPAVASPSPSPSPPPQASPSPEPSDENSSDSGSGLSSGAAAGIAIAVILAVVAGVAGFVYMRRRRHLASGANPLGNNRFERFEDGGAFQDDSNGAWGQHTQQQSPAGWQAYGQQQGGGVQMSSRNNHFDP